MTTISTNARVANTCRSSINSAGAAMQEYECLIGVVKYSNKLKSGFSRGLPGDAPRTRRSPGASAGCGRAGIGNTRFAMTPVPRHVDYIHFNPVKHGLVSRECDRPQRSVKHYVAHGDLPPDCGGNLGKMSGTFAE